MKPAQEMLWNLSTAALLIVQLSMTCLQCSGVLHECEQDNSCGRLNENECYNYSLEELPENLGNNTQVLMCSSNVSLNATIRLSLLHNISITSLLPKTTITCNSEDETGIEFSECCNITFSKLTIKGCGFQLKKPKKTTATFRSSLYVLNCINVRFNNVSITDSDGTGLIMLDTFGKIDFTNCMFAQNKILRPGKNQLGGGSGVFLDVTSPTTQCATLFKGTHNDCCCSINQHSTYNFENCHFLDNTASRADYQNKSNRILFGLRLERGGGLSITIRTPSIGNSIKINKGVFRNNSAEWGGGLYIVYYQSPEDNTVEITNTKFIENQCSTHVQKGGGGASIGYSFYREKPSRNNNIVFTNCRFVRNKGNFGGGITIFSSRSTDSGNGNVFRFINCEWIGNQAPYGSALTALPQVWDALKSGFLPTPVFVGCTFTSNTMPEAMQTTTTPTLYQFYNGKGALLISRFTVEFQGNTSFTGSNSSALYMTSGIVKFARGSVAQFFNNSGMKGGAISLHGFSAIYASDNSIITFEGNQATNRGGAIYFYSFNKQDYMHSRSCFIQYEGEEVNVQNRNLSFIFRDNIAREEKSAAALQFGHSIFATNLLPCKNNCSQLTSEKDYCQMTGTDKFRQAGDIFACIGTFTFENEESPVATSGRGFCSLSNDPHPLKVIPGKEVQVPITLEDDLNQSVLAVYHVSINQNSQNSQIITVDNLYTFTHEAKIKLYGNPTATARVEIATVSIREVAVSFKVEMQHCPPGFVMNGSKLARQCVCSALTKGKYYKSYMGVHTCDVKQFQAYLSRGFWIGYKGDDKDDIGREDSLVSAYCPKTFCFQDQPENEMDNQNKHKLTNTSSRSQLDQLVCGQNRTGTLCGKCRTNFSAYYHSESYHCYQNNRCQWGPVFYILSELLPVSILFIIVVVFNISFTSGAVNGALFCIQVVITMHTTANNFIYIPMTSTYRQIFIKAYNLIYRSFNLNFFTLFTDETSFCLWKRAGVLDIIAFKYITIIYSLLLVVTTVAVIKICNYSLISCCCCKTRSKRGRDFQSSIIHGLSAFFVMSYSQCTRVSLELLTPGHIRPLATHNHSSFRRVAFYDGELDFFQREHLKYAIPAMFFTVVFILIPPTLLIVYPLCYRIFAVLKIGETRCVQVTCKVVPLERLKPLFDSFQGSFKDEYRFFSGLYFLYRLVPLAAFAFTSSLTDFYTILEVLLLCTLTLHSIAQPYKKRWHNILDTFLFSNLTVINTMTMYNYTLASDGRDYQWEIDTVTLIQGILMSLPLVYITIYTAAQLIITVKRYCDSHRTRTSTDETDNEPNWILMNDNSDT